ncbi:MAG: heme-binding protein [Hyphomicrobiales bacterium]|nr:heme-binding protein [Hyphomicrobiales bacterium]
MAHPPVTIVASSMTLEKAEAIASGVLSAGRSVNALPLCVAVIDSGGQLVVYKREDGCGIARFNIALGKASGALGMGMSSRTIRDALGDRPAFQNAIAAATDGRFVPVPGGVLILDDQGIAIGAAGVSGDSSECDEFAAITAIRAAGLTPDPAEPDPAWLPS